MISRLQGRTESDRVVRGSADKFSEALNAVCPYYTMFPLSFPMGVLRGRAKQNDWVADPFCGRGTTNFAARLLGLNSVGIDSSPVASALTKAKLASARPCDVVRVASRILDDPDIKVRRPIGPFWDRAYQSNVLHQICKLRKALLIDCKSDARILLRAIILGTLHGPLTKTKPSYLSNQSPRTFAPKPEYAARYWSKHRLKPPCVDIRDVIRARAERYLTSRPLKTQFSVTCGDSRNPELFGDSKFRWIVTSPPYYGMRTYIPDQWLRNWFTGGPSYVVYKPPASEIRHSSPEEFAANLRDVWIALANSATNDARLVVRFGGINDRQAEPADILKLSLKDSGWRLQTAVSAGDANEGRRQARQFLANGPSPRNEFDYYARLD